MTSFNEESDVQAFRPGDTLPEAVRYVSQENINLYAQASGDFNPIHVDETFAAKTPLGGTVAHGMLVLAYISQMITASFGPSWLSSGRLTVRFKMPARPGDTLTIEGKIKSIESREDISYARCNILCRNQKGEAIVSGQATAGLPLQSP